MIHSVSGTLNGNQLGITLMHEHITWNRAGANSMCNTPIDEIVNTMLPNLLNLKKAGCSTFVDATTNGSGRNLIVLEECAKRSGLNILTNTGAWDGGDCHGDFIPDSLKSKNIDDIVSFWSDEFHYGMEGTTIKPAYLKIALGDTGEINALQEKFLRAACRTSLITQLPIQCHTIPACSAIKAIKIVEEESLPLNKFIWVHGDVEQNTEIIMTLLKKDAWVEFDFLGRCNSFQWYIEMFNHLSQEALLHKILLSQDAGAYYIGEKNESFIPYDRIFTEFIPFCLEQGISQEVFTQLLITNPQKVLDL